MVSNKEKQGPLKLLLEKGKKKGFITYAELNKKLPKAVVEAGRLEEIIEVIDDFGIQVEEEASNPKQINTDTAVIPKSTSGSKKTQSRMTKIEEVENVSLSISNGQLLIQIDLNQEIGTTKRGKIRIAATHGNKFYELDGSIGCSLSLTVYKD